LIPAESTLRVVGKTLDDERAEREAKRLAKKRKMKQMFDSEYDETRQHYVQAKTEMSEQAEKNRQVGEDGQCAYDTQQVCRHSLIWTQMRASHSKATAPACTCACVLTNARSS
jgi:hypothetical protein